MLKCRCRIKFQEAQAAPGLGNATMSDFTPRAQQVLVLARKEAERFNHNYVGTEHLLLGLIKRAAHSKSTQEAYFHLIAST